MFDKLEDRLVRYEEIMNELNERELSDLFRRINDIDIEDFVNIYDEIIDVKDEDALEYGRLIAKKEGVLVGISSGATLFSAIEVAKRPENKGKTIVALLTDTGERYLSTAMFS